MVTNDQPGDRNSSGQQSASGQPSSQQASERAQTSSPSAQQSGFQDVHRGSGTSGSSGQGASGASSSGQGASSYTGSAQDDMQRSGSSMQTSQRGSRQGEVQARRSGYPQFGTHNPWSQFPTAYGGGPFSLMRRMTEEMDRLFDAFGMGGGGFSSDYGQRSTSAYGGQTGQGPGASLWAPHVEVRENEGKLQVIADLPGIRKEDINVEVTQDSIVLQGQRQQENTQNERGYYRSERSYGSFYRTIPLPEGVEVDKANATFRDGVLQIDLPLSQQTRGRKLEIRDSVFGGSGQTGSRGESPPGSGSGMNAGASASGASATASGPGQTGGGKDPRG